MKEKVHYVPPNIEMAVDCYGLSSLTKLLLTVFTVFLKCVDYLTSHFFLQSCWQHHILADISVISLASAAACVWLVCVSDVVPC
jgi:hypothetical protein